MDRLRIQARQGFQVDPLPPRKNGVDRQRGSASHDKCVVGLPRHDFRHMFAGMVGHGDEGEPCVPLETELAVLRKTLLSTTDG
jgi:hypothetical protein